MDAQERARLREEAVKMAGYDAIGVANGSETLQLLEDLNAYEARVEQLRWCISDLRTGAEQGTLTRAAMVILATDALAADDAAGGAHA